MQNQRSKGQMERPKAGSDLAFLPRKGDELHSSGQEHLPEFSIVVPCYNEVTAIQQTLQEIRNSIPEDAVYTIILVDDGSTDGTSALLESFSSSNIKVISHSRNRGYGAALKSGIRAAETELIAITDADGTYPNDRLPELIALCRDHDMVVGARTSKDVTYSRLRAFPKLFLRIWISWIARQNVPDINSGMRVFRRSIALDYFGILPDGFSFTITITLAMLTSFKSVVFLPISYKSRVGASKIKPIRDTISFIKLVIRTGMYFAPLRSIMPLFVIIFSAATASAAYDVFVLANLTDKTIILFLFSMNTMMFGLLADMIDKRVGR